MSLKSNIEDGDGSGLIAHVRKFSTAERNDHAGLLTLTKSFQEFNSEVHLFLNDSFGTAMNQNISFGGTPEVIHSGSLTEWVGTAVAGVWNFTDSEKITITSANNNDLASFAEENTLTIDMSGFKALTGKVDLDIYNSINNSIDIQFNLSGTLVGNNIDLNNYINTGDFSEQNFVIPKADLGLTTQSLDGMALTITRTGGTKPTIKFDDIQFEETGDPAVFKVTTPIGTRFHITEINLTLIDNITGITTVAGAAENATVPNLSYDKLLSISALSNGIIFSRVQKGKVLFSSTIKQLGDFLAEGSHITNHISDGTNTFINISIMFSEPIILEGRSDEFLSFTINDDLSSLLQFTATTRGALEV